MSDYSEFQSFTKIHRFKRDIVITEKIDGTNGQISIPEDPSLPVLAGSRNRWVTPGDDNFGFAAWVYANAETLRAALGPGRHYGEWWGAGIQRRYGMTEKVFSLFNVERWPAQRPLPAGVRTVPKLYHGPMDQGAIEAALTSLRVEGSRAAPGFMQPEGIIVYLVGPRVPYKITLDGDGHKGGQS